MAAEDGEVAFQEAWKQYLGLVHRELRSNYTVPKGVVERGTPLKAVVVLYIEPDGRVARWRFDARSGDSEFDSAIDELVERVRLPPPPVALRKRYGTGGLKPLKLVVEWRA